VVATSLKSDNASSAENQQERLLSAEWISGFVDGEGCFSIGLVRQPDREGRKGYKTGFQVAPDFSVVQGAKSVGVLWELKEFFRVGNVYRNSRHDDHKEDLFRFSVRRVGELSDVIVPFFRTYPLRTAKRLDFEKFSRCVELMRAKRHLEHAGLADLLEIAQTMNRQLSRSELIRILRDHTPET
jgi:hypothetical protein